MGLEQGLPRGHLVGAQDRGAVAVSPRPVSVRGHLLAPVEALGRGRRMAECLADAARSAGRRRLVEVGRKLS